MEKYQVLLYKVDKNSDLTPFWPTNEYVDMLLSYEPQGYSAKFVKGTNQHNNETVDNLGDDNIRELFEFPISSQTENFKFGTLGQILNLGDESVVLKFLKEEDVRKFRQKVQQLHKTSVFSQRTEESSASQYFQFYGFLSQQQNMMQDYVRTSTYQKAIHSNLSDFEGKVVLDVGAGSGILSFFAAQAGAKKVYAVEASNMAQYAHQLVQANHLGDKIKVIAGKIEEIDLPEIDVIISEPMGYMLFNERMLETFLHAKKWLKPGGKMFPSRGDLHIAPFTDESLYIEQYNKANFWFQTHFHGVDLSSMRSSAMKEYFRQPVVDTFDIKCVLAKSVRHIVDFMTAEEQDLHKITIPLEFVILETGTVHGLAVWFDVLFEGQQQKVFLSTSPTEPLTHWYQVRCLLTTPLFVKQGYLLKGTVELIANKRQSYDVSIELCIAGHGDQIVSSNNTYDLKNPYFRYSGAPGYTPGAHSSSPSEIWWNTLDTQRNTVNVVNGVALNGMGEAVHMDSSGAAIIDPNIHPGCISSTGRTTTRVSNQSGLVNNQITLTGMTIPGIGVATSTQNAAQQALIGGAISPSVFGNVSHPTTWW